MGADSLFIKQLRPVSKTVETSYTRPADTTTYASGDVVANSTSAATILTFANMSRANGLGGIIQGATLIDSVSAALKPEFELYLFDTAPAMQNDNAAWAPSDAELDKCLGYIAFASGGWRTGTSSGNGLIDIDALAKSYQCAPASTSLFGVLVARNAYVPASGEKFTVRLHVIQD
jgi:hypothetical protein